MAIRYTCDWCGNDIKGNGDQVPKRDQLAKKAANGAGSQLSLNIGAYNEEGQAADIHWRCLAVALHIAADDIIIDAYNEEGNWRSLAVDDIDGNNPLPQRLKDQP